MAALKTPPGTDLGEIVRREEAKKVPDNHKVAAAVARRAADKSITLGEIAEECGHSIQWVGYALDAAKALEDPILGPRFRSRQINSLPVVAGLVLLCRKAPDIVKEDLEQKLGPDAGKMFCEPVNKALFKSADLDRLAERIREERPRSAGGALKKGRDSTHPLTNLGKIMRREAKEKVPDNFKIAQAVARCVANEFTFVEIAEECQRNIQWAVHAFDASKALEDPILGPRFRSRQINGLPLVAAMVPRCRKYPDLVKAELERKLGSDAGKLFCMPNSQTLFTSKDLNWLDVLIRREQTRRAGDAPENGRDSPSEASLRGRRYVSRRWSRQETDEAVARLSELLDEDVFSHSEVSTLIVEIMRGGTSQTELARWLGQPVNFISKEYRMYETAFSFGEDSELARRFRADQISNPGILEELAKLYRITPEYADAEIRRFLDGDADNPVRHRISYMDAVKFRLRIEKKAKDGSLDPLPKAGEAKPQNDREKPVEHTAGLRTIEIPETSGEKTSVPLIDSTLLSLEACLDIYFALLKRKNLILHGAAGVGKTYVANQLCREMIGALPAGETPESRIMSVHGSELDDETLRGDIISFCRKAAVPGDLVHMLLIDAVSPQQLRRGLDPWLHYLAAEQRGKSFRLRRNEIVFPPNLYVVCTMNTAGHRFAFEMPGYLRRFAVIEIEPQFESTRFQEWVRSQKSPDFNQFVKHLVSLNKEIADDPSLGRDFRFGQEWLLCQSILDDLPLAVITGFAPAIRDLWPADRSRAEGWIEKLMMATEGIRKQKQTLKTPSVT